MFSNSLSLRIIRASVNSLSGETLRVAEAQARDANREIVRIDSRVMRERSLASGDVLEITGAKKMMVLVWPGSRRRFWQRIEHTRKGSQQT